MKRPILLAIAVCLVQLAYAQSDFRNGYVITISGDSLKGLVDYREGSKAYSSCDFKPSNDQQTVTYEPGKIIGYGFVNDKFFQSKEIPRQDSVAASVFAEVIVKGLANLYKVSSRYFMEKENSGMLPLINVTRIVNIDGKRHFVNSNQFISTLNMHLFDCAGVRSRIQKATLSEQSLSNLFEKYNTCKGERFVTHKAKKPWLRLAVGIAGGINYSQVSFKEKTGFYEYLTQPFDPSTTPLAGLSINLLSPRISEHFSFNVDMFYIHSTYQNTSRMKNGIFMIRNYVTIDVEQFKIPFGIRYTFPKRNFTPFINAGASTTFHLNSESEWRRELESYGVVETETKEALIFKKNQLGVWGGVGVAKSMGRKLDLVFELRYERTNGVARFATVSDQLTSTISNFQGVIGIRTK